MENPEPFVERKKNDASNSTMISKTLEKFDIFGAPVTFYFRKNSTITSSTGGCVSLSVVIICPISYFFSISILCIDSQVFLHSPLPGVSSTACRSVTTYKIAKLLCYYFNKKIHFAEV